MDYLNSDAKADFDQKVKDYDVPEAEWDTLAIGVFYLWEWKKIAVDIAAAKVDKTKHDKGQDADRLNPELRYFDTCWKNWEKVAYAYGMNPLGKKKVGMVQVRSPKEKRKTKTSLRKIGASWVNINEKLE